MVFVLDRKKRPLMPCSEKRARLLLKRGRAVVHKMAPFTIRLKDRRVEESRFQPQRLKLDPGSKTTGVAVLRGESPAKAVAIHLGQIQHKLGVKDRLDTRRNARRNRRHRNVRHREPRFLNRQRERGWLPPSLEARIDQTQSAVTQLRQLLPITAISTEHGKFDTQLLQNPDIASVEYQRGELFGYEVKEYLLEKWQRKCAYCGATDVPLQIEHVVPKNPARGPKGTDRVSNLTIACQPCNQAKGNQLPEAWLPKLKRSQREIDQRRAENLPKLLEDLKRPLQDAAMMNATRWALYERLKRTGLPVECGTGARTKKQRVEHGLPKTHYYDACCVGASTPATLRIDLAYVAVWSAVGRGTRKVCNIDRWGFPVSHRKQKKNHFGFQTGDWVVAEVPEGQYAGHWIGRVAVRAKGYFDLRDGYSKRLCQGISWKHFRVLQRGDGWQYENVAAERTQGDGAGSSPCVNAGASAVAEDR